MGTFLSNLAMETHPPAKRDKLYFVTPLPDCDDRHASREGNEHPPNPLNDEGTSLGTIGTF